MKVAIYGRYSSENQRDASIADQFRVCREFAPGLAGRSRVFGPCRLGRDEHAPWFPGDDARSAQKKFDIVMAEALDRFSRDQEDTAGLFKRLTFAGVNTSRSPRATSRTSTSV